jgi:hypothetical protein
VSELGYYLNSKKKIKKNKNISFCLASVKLVCGVRECSFYLVQDFRRLRREERNELETGRRNGIQVVQMREMKKRVRVDRKCGVSKTRQS